MRGSLRFSDVPLPPMADATPGEPSPLRRQPRQARSQERVRRILSAAEGLFVDDGRARLDHLLVSEKDWLRYVYDMGDSWHHRITLEKVLVEPLR